MKLAACLLVAFVTVVASSCAHAPPRPVVQLRVDSNVADATVWIDDTLVGASADWQKDGRHIPAGFHRVEIRHPSYYSVFQEIDVPAGGATVVHAQLRPLLQ